MWRLSSGSISSPLVELIESGRLPAVVHLLRPPTFDNLREHLAAHPHTYHVLHFDGHGSYQKLLGYRWLPRSRGPGELCLRTNAATRRQSRSMTSVDLLREHSVPVVVLNAC